MCMIVSMLIHILSIFILSVQTDYPLRDGRPTSEGIREYVHDNADSLIRQYEQFIGDTLYNVWIYTGDLTRHGIADTIELGFYYSDEIYISDAELFYAYELKDLPRYLRASAKRDNRFVKSTILHELSHDYFAQVAWEMIGVDSVHVDRAFMPYVWVLREHESFGSRFIEEGICEYIVEKMGEVITQKKPRAPRSIEELTSTENEYMMMYRYSAYFLKDFLDQKGFKQGLKILAHNPPPRYDEILNPDRYFNRLKEPVPISR